MMFLQLSMVVQTYFWPLYFQSVRGTSAKQSGIFMLPLCISSSITTFSTGWVISKLRHYVPFMWIGSIVLITGSGLFQTTSVNSSLVWIGFQIISGIGYGLCGQVPMLAVQVVLEKEDVPTGCVLVIFFQCLGGALATSVGQNLFTDNLLKALNRINGVDAKAIVAAGGIGFRQLVGPTLLSQVISCFESALKNVFLLALAGAAFSFVVSPAMQWRKLPAGK